MMKRLAILFFVFLFFLVNDLQINATTKNNYQENLNLFKGQSTLVLLSKNNVAYDNKMIDLKQVYCEKDNCFYELKALGVGKISFKDKKMYEYNITIRNHQEVARSSSLNNDDLYDVKLFELFKKYGISSMLEVEKFTEEKSSKFFDEIELLKQEVFKEDNYLATERTTYQGDIFLTVDSSTFKVPHGHAGIGTSGNNNDIIEANPKDGVKKYSNRIQNYWKQCKKATKRYTVVGSTTQQKNKAFKVAESKIRKPYGLIVPGDTHYFCTKLVWTAWNYSGASKKIGNYLFATDMMASKSLKLLETYHK